MPNPLAGFQYALDIGGKVSGFFQDCSGIGSEHEIIEQKLTDANGRPFIQKLPGRMKWNDVTLKRGITAEMDLWKWRKMVEDGDVDGARTHCSIVMMSRTGKPVAQWDFTNAWPSKVSGPELKSDSNDFGVEELVIVHEGMTRVK
jgi:phage tail-like protein